MSRGQSKRSLELVRVAKQILGEIQPASVRALCYRLFVAGLISNMGKSSTNGVSRLIRIAREDGDIPWEWIVDESREAETITMWRDPDEIIKAAVRGYRRDYWQDQPRRVEVWSEKGTVRGTLRPVLDEYGSRLPLPLSSDYLAMTRRLLSSTVIGRALALKDLYIAQRTQSSSANESPRPKPHLRLVK